MPAFSIVIPSLNSGAVLERAIRSVTGQDHNGVQLILADAGSTGESRRLIERHRHLFDPLLSEPDRGEADGLNRGFAHARGDIFGWLCADDELLPGALGHVAAAFRSDPRTDVVFGRCERVYPDGTRAITDARPEFWRDLGVRNGLDQPAVFWRSSLHRRIGDLDTSFELAFDWDFWCRMRASGARAAAIQPVLARYHFSPGNKSSVAGDLHARESYRVLRRYGPIGGRLADVYSFLYRHFDLRGCFDAPRSSSPLRSAACLGSLAVLRCLLGRRLVCSYNWHFASCQQRGLPWW